jgi:hexosaminidase
MTRILLCIALCCALRTAWASTRTIPIVPQPHSITDRGGSVRFDPSAAAMHLAVRDTQAIAPVIAEICSTSVALYGNAPSLGGKGRVVIWAGIPGMDAAFDRLCKSSNVVLNERLGDEGYVLLVESRNILIAGRGTRGVFYGLESFLQLLRGSSLVHGTLPQIHVVDWPDMAVRAVMDDISRGPVPSPEYLRRQIRRFAEMKINTVFYYTEHVVLTERHPEFAPPGGALSIAEWKQLSQYAARYHIDLVGNFQSFGHFEKILSTPRYAHLGDGKSLLSPAIEESYDFLKDVYTEMVPAFQSSFFNINCDETFELGHGRSKVLVDSLGIGRVYLNHILRLRSMLQQLGVRPMIWGDVLLQHPEIIPLVPRDVVIGTWTYDSLADFHKYISPFQSLGFSVLVTPGVLNSSNIIPNFRQSFLNIARFIRDGVRQNVTGGLITVWDDGGCALFSTDWYGVAFGADRMWNSDTLDRTFDQRFEAALYADPANALSRGIRTLMHVGDFIPTDGMSEKAMWSRMIPLKNRPLRLNVRDWDSVLATARMAGEVLDSGRPKVELGDYEAMRFVAELYQGVAHLCLGMRDGARLYRSALASEAIDSRKARSLIVSARALVANLRLEFSRLRNWYTNLWLTENRVYALDLIERRYTERIDDLSDIEISLRDAIERLDKGDRLPPPSAVRLDIVESMGWYFRDWLVTGPIQGNDLRTDYLASMGGESWKKPPQVTQEFEVGDMKARWSRLSAQSAAEVLFSEIHPDAGPSTMYAYATIESPSECQILGLLGIGGTGRILVNGHVVFERSVQDSLIVDRDTLRIPLFRGTNQILIKICKGTFSDWGLSFRLPECDVRNRKNRYKIVAGK